MRSSRLGSTAGKCIASFSPGMNLNLSQSIKATSMKSISKSSGIHSAPKKCMESRLGSSAFSKVKSELASSSFRGPSVSLSESLSTKMNKQSGIAGTSKRSMSAKTRVTSPTISNVSVIPGLSASIDIVVGGADGCGDDDEDGSSEEDKPGH